MRVALISHPPVWVTLRWWGREFYLQVGRVVLLTTPKRRADWGEE